MKIKTIMMAIACLVVWQACYDDKGNYDYTELTEVAITMAPPSTNGYVGELYSYTPEVSYGKGVDADNFEYWWEQRSPFEGEVVRQDGKTLNFTPDATGRFGWTFFIRENDTDVVTSQTLYVNVTSIYNRGWTLLSNDNGKSIISYIRPEWVEDAGGKTRKYVPYLDIYNAYPEQTLGSGPTALYQVLRSSGTAMLVAQESGAVSLNGNTFMPDVVFTDEFIAPSPTGLQLKEYMETSYLSVAIAMDGKVYSRYLSNAALYVDNFMNFPTEYNGETIKAESSVYLRNYSSFFVGFGLIEKEKKRVSWINVDHYFWSRVFPSVMNVSEEFPEYLDFTNFGDNKIIYIGTYAPALASAPLTIIYSRNGEYYLQESKATTVRATMQNVSISVEKHKPFPGKEFISDNSVFFMLETRPYLFFAERNKVYWYDPNTENVHNIYTFAAGENVVALGSNPQESELGVALENGTFATINIENDKMYSNLLVGTVKNIPGKIVSMKYKFASATAYQLRIRSASYAD